MFEWLYLKKKWHDVKYLCGLKKLSVERTSEGRYTCPSLRTSPLVIVTANQILAPPSGPHGSARGVRNVSTQRRHESFHYLGDKCTCLWTSCPRLLAESITTAAGSGTLRRKSNARTISLRNTLATALIQSRAMKPDMILHAESQRSTHYGFPTIMRYTNQHTHWLHCLICDICGCISATFSSWVTFPNYWRLARSYFVV